VLCVAARGALRQESAISLRNRPLRHGSEVTQAPSGRFRPAGIRSLRNPCCLAPWMRVETVLLGGLCPLIPEFVLPRAVDASRDGAPGRALSAHSGIRAVRTVGRSAIFGAGRRSLIGAGSARRRRPARTGCCHQPAAATSGMPAEEPAASHVPMFSRAKSWSRTIADAPITPARPPNEDRWISRSRVASGRERR
jgi:hypothetical protein